MMSNRALSLVLVTLVACGGDKVDKPTAPVAPTGFTATPGNAEVTLTWNASVGATSYTIYWSTTSGVTPTNGNSLTGVTSPFVHDQLTNDRPYFYVITASNDIGESGPSEEIGATPRPGPPAPMNLRATTGDSQVTLEWDLVAAAISYNLYWSADPSVTTADNAITDVDSGYEHRDLENEKTYYYRVAAVSVIGEGALSNEISAVPYPPNQAPPAPTNVVATAGDGLVTLTWDAAPGALSYNIYRSESTGVDTSDQASMGVSSGFDVINLTNGTTYYFVVTAQNAGGEGPISDEVSATPDAGFSPPDPPTNVAALAGNGSVQLTWDASATATSYNVYWSDTTGTGTDGTEVEGVSSGDSITGLANGTEYFFVVTAENAAGESDPSTEVSATPAPPAVPPAAPVNVAAVAAEEQVTITWSPVLRATSYNIYWSDTSGTGTSGTKVTGATSGDAVTGLTNGTPYYFVVTAENTFGESDPSAEATATPVPATEAPDPPTNVVAYGGPEQVTVYWAPSTGATSYTIYWSLSSGVSTSDTAVTGAASGEIVGGLTNDTRVYVAVTASNSVGESGLSAEVSAVPSDPDIVTVSTNGGTAVSHTETETVDSPTGFDPDLRASLDLTAAWGSAPEPATTVLVRAGYAGDAWSEILIFEFYGATTGTFTIAGGDLRARYFGNGTDYVSDDGTITSGTVEVTAADDVGGKLVGTYDLLLCLESNCLASTITLAGTFNVGREVDVGTVDNPRVLTPAIGEPTRVDAAVTSSYYRITPVTVVESKVYLNALGADVDLHVFSDDAFTTSLCDSTNAGTDPEDCVVTPTGDSLFVEVERQAGSGADFLLTVAELASLPFPGHVSAVPGDGEVLVRWDTVEDATSYTIYWGTASGATDTAITNVTSPYTHTGRTNDTEYFYVVTATVPATGEGPPSVEDSATPGTVQPPVEWVDWPGRTITNANATGCGALGALARSLQVAQANDVLDVNVRVNVTHPFVRDVDLFLEYDNGETVVCVELSTGNGGSGNNYANTTFDAEANTAITDGSAPFNAEPYIPEGDLTQLYGLPMTATWTLYASDSYSGGDTGTLNNWYLEITYAGPPPPPPAAPENLVAETGDTELIVSWDLVADASSYTLYWSESPNVTTSSPNSFVGVSPPFVHTGLINDATYYYIVTGSNAGGEGAPSAEASGTPEEATEGIFSDPVGGLEIPYVSGGATGCGTVGAMARPIVTSRTDAIHDVNVGIEITHPYTGDLEFFLEFDNHGDPICIELSTDNGGSGDDFVGTVFDHEADTSIEDGDAPFTGNFRPEGSLLDLFNLPMDGTWTLWISDDYSGDVGYLDEWYLYIQWGDQLPPPQPTGVVAQPWNTQVNVRWDPMRLADTFNVYWSETPDIDIGTATNVVTELTEPSFSHEGLTNGTTYYYVVTAVNAVGESLPSPEVSATPFSVVHYTDSPGTAIVDSSDATTCAGANNYTSSTITITETGTLSDVDIEIDISHNWLSDVDIWVEFDNGSDTVCVELSTDNGGTGDNYVDTVFDDEASTAVTSGSAPFTGSYRPEGSLSDFDGLSMTGTFTIYASDDAGGIEGTLNSWGVILGFDE